MQLCIQVFDYSSEICKAWGDFSTRGGHLQAILVPMLEQTNAVKEYFFSIWSVHSAVIIKGRKKEVLFEKGVFFKQQWKESTQCLG